MKIKKYESITFLYTVIFIVTIILSLLIIFSMKKYIRTYTIINSRVINNNFVEILVTDKELKTIYNNKYLYVDKKKKIVKLEKINKKVLKRNNKYYHNIILKTKLDSKVKINDTKKILFFNGKITMFDMMKVIWKGV